MSIKVAINGYGRIWRNFHRIALQQENEIEVVAINTRSEDINMRAHLLKYDSIHGKIDADIKIDGHDIITNHIRVKNTSITNAAENDWKGIDVVLECSWKAKTYDIAARHLDWWVERVLVSAPMKDNTKTIVIWTNEQLIDRNDKVISNASCTTNCIAPPLKIINKHFGINFCYVNSVHSFTHSQNLLDNSGRDLRRARSAVQSIIPTTSWAMKAISQVVPELEGKIDWLAIRVPIATSSVCECVLHLERPVTVELLNNTIREEWKNLFGGRIIGVADEELVSIDFKSDTRSWILDPFLTKVDSTWRHVQIMLWYDNEWAYACRLLDIIKLWLR